MKQLLRTLLLEQPNALVPLICSVSLSAVYLFKRPKVGMHQANETLQFYRWQKCTSA